MFFSLRVFIHIPFSINGRDVRDYDFYQVYDLLRQKGKTVKLTLARGQERIEKALTLRRLLYAE